MICREFSSSIWGNKLIRDIGVILYSLWGFTNLIPLESKKS
jgi:hypothetical protein